MTGGGNVTRDIPKCFSVRFTAVSNRLKRLLIVRKKVEFLQSFSGKLCCQIIHIFGAESLLARQGDGLNCFQDRRECYRTFRISGRVSKTVSDLFIILLLQTFLGIATYGFVSV